ncbi:MAG: 2-hydroxyhepta-2,4-diene-1,7-dioate isomerase [Gammaproteobacteria bacterium CG_4_10_14_0_8_um_filter_38_16]|nr:MAG: 2-hydroxyhepta-2,4-diene-1,7-dioate isomerase [Gammaproteobacteria bacterium CG_4_10_14_0_8_um_filter_38_16]PJA04378.1 MAG: 2-hydroxyhepta-2,4-diene-1,7-dioate isomerase [Gammaproteobacteria bacterium CG_4_10_14_0_2_um_filter_38_22]PJB10201.1 MAG: 2-hydroxyhepta-2,4-diene-1,7-dioate isomerase [Gammaproteobacteria bacterium CG_4_9_14_3_um_filter_38_9]
MKIICIGRNYQEHARELNNAIPTEPVIFLKPETALLTNNRPFIYPSFSKNIHHEIEVVLKIDKTGKNFNAIGIGIDFTARDIQDHCKKNGLPWEKAKAFDHSAVISNFISKEKFQDLSHLHFSLDINGKKVQSGNTADMIFSFETLLKAISRYFTLQENDLIFTGTPAGVGAVHHGDTLTGYLESQAILHFVIQ